ncbi:unnamed protein product, partial [Didymodactylos carnosus]
SSPKKQNAGRPKIQLTTLEQDTIRLTFHLLLKDKIYPTLENLLSALLAQEPDFPIRSRMSLQRQLKLIGFKYRQTKKANVLMDATAFQAQRAVYFRKLEELRSFKAVLYYHDETWMNRNEEKTLIWFDDEGFGRLRNSEGKGQRLAISGLISLSGFHLRSLDMFKYDKVHSMDSKHFVEWMETTASTLGAEHGKATPIAILIDNATWHNKLTPESEPPKRAWQKALVTDWLTQRKIKFELYMTKAELLELAFQHLPPREYIVDRAAKKFDVQIV